MYTDKTALELVFGTQNIKRWADLDGDENLEKINARVAYACEVAESELEAIFRQKRYVLPLPETFVVKDLATKLAGLKLHDARKIIDSDSTPDTLSLVRQEVQNTIEKIRLGELILGDIHATTIPVVVKDVEEKKNTQFDPFTLRR